MAGSNAGNSPICDLAGHESTRWIDLQGIPHCLICQVPPSRAYVRRIERLEGNTWQPDDQPAAKQEPSEIPLMFSFDPFTEKPPAGVWFPYGDPIRRLEREAKSEVVGRCRCGGHDVRTSPARGGEWVREYCGRCGRTIALLEQPGGYGND